MRTASLLAIAISLLGVVLISPGLQASETLYHQLGGREEIRPMVDDFVEVVIQDSRLRLNSSARKFLDQCNPAEMKRRVFEVFCEGSGGPCRSRYAQAALQRSLKTMQLTRSDWQALMADVRAEMDKFKIGPVQRKEIRVLLKQVEPKVVRD